MKKIFTIFLMLFTVVTFAHNGEISLEKSSALNNSQKSENVILPQCWDALTQVAFYRWTDADQNPLGWILGTNSYGDAAVAQVFENDATLTLAGAHFWIAVVGPGSGDIIFSINEMADGSIGNVISSVTMPLSEVVAYMTDEVAPADYANSMYVEFENMVEVTSDFALVVDYSAVTYSAHGDGIAIVSNNLSEPCEAGHVFIQDGDGVWNVSTDVNAALKFVSGMFPVIGQPSENHMVTFRVNMVEAVVAHDFDPAVHNVFVTGNFLDPEWPEPGTEGSVELTLEAPTKEDVVILEEGFEGEVFPPAGWAMLDEDGDGNLWFAYAAENSAHTGTRSAASASWFDGSALTPDNWLMTPALNIENDSYMLEFYVGAQDPDWAEEKYAVLISTTDTDPASFTSVWEETLADGEWHMREVDLTDYAGEQIYIAFRHYDVTDMFYIKIDDVKVYGAGAPQPDDIFYTATVEIPAGDIEYKYFSDAVGEGWAGGEWEAGDNRTATIAADVTLDDVFGLGTSVQNILAETGLNLFPNPVRNTLYVENTAQINEVRIYDLTGRLIMSQVVNNNTASVNVSEFNRGVYIMQVVSENGVAAQKFNVIK